MAWRAAEMAVANAELPHSAGQIRRASRLLTPPPTEATPEEPTPDWLCAS
jgi:hypothetical protein